MAFERSEIAKLNDRVIVSTNTFTILYHSTSMVFSLLIWLITRKNLIVGQKWIFWALLLGISFVEVMAWTDSAGVGNARWQVNAVQSVLHVVGIGMAGYFFFKRQAVCITDKKNNLMKSSSCLFGGPDGIRVRDA